jgi:hypothetical protein
LLQDNNSLNNKCWINNNFHLDSTSSQREPNSSQLLSPRTLTTRIKLENSSMNLLKELLAKTMLLRLQECSLIYLWTISDSTSRTSIYSMKKSSKLNNS